MVNIVMALFFHLKPKCVMAAFSNDELFVYLLLILTDSVLDFICVLLLVFFFRRFDFVSFFPSQGPHNALRIFSKVKIRRKKKKKKKEMHGFSHSKIVPI